MQTFTPLEYLKIDIASNFGLDKENWDSRITWFDNHVSEIQEISKLADKGHLGAISKHPLFRQADSRALFFAGIRAWDKASRGEAIAYGISLDATASGAQLLSLLIGCDKSARLCNVLDTGRREDLYTNVFEFMCDRLEESGAMAGGIVRDDAKAAIMTSLYGSQAEPKRVFGEGDQLRIFYEVMEEEAPGIWNLNQSLLGLWRSDLLSHDWVLPDNFHVKTKVMVEQEETVQFLNVPYTVRTKVNAPSESGLSIGANVIHSIDGMVVREMHRRCSYDASRMAAIRTLLESSSSYLPVQRRPQDDLVNVLWDRYLETSFLSTRILDLLDEENIHLVDKGIISELLLSLPEKPFPVLSVHDCFRVHPNYANDLRTQYNRILYDLAHSSVLASVATQISGEKVQVSKYDLDPLMVLDADYALS